jgi:hypothetical protein
MKSGFPFLLAFFLSATLHGGTPAGSSACAWPVTLPEITRETPVYLPLPPEVHARTGGISAGLTIRDGQGFLLPMRLRPAETTVTREVTETRTLTTQIKEAETLADGSLRVLCQVDKNAADTFRRIQIVTPSKDFSQQVVVEAGDGQQWGPLGEAVLVDLSRYLKFNRTEIVLPQPTATTWLRFTFRTPEKNTENDYCRIVTRLQGGSEVERQVTSEQTKQRFRVDAIACSADKLCQKAEPVAVMRQQAAAIERQELPGKTRLTIPCDWGTTALIVATPLKNFARSCRVKADQFEAEAMLQVIDLPGSSPSATLTIPLPRPLPDRNHRDREWRGTTAANHRHHPSGAGARPAVHRPAGKFLPAGLRSRRRAQYHRDRRTGSGSRPQREFPHRRRTCRGQAWGDWQPAGRRLSPGMVQRPPAADAGHRHHVRLPRLDPLPHFPPDPAIPKCLNRNWLS